MAEEGKDKQADPAVDADHQLPPSTHSPIPPLPRFHGALGGGNSPSPAKESWPELVGLKADEAEKKIKEEFPGATVQVVGPDHCVTCDFKTSRVRLYIDTSGKVDTTPRIG